MNRPLRESCQGRKGKKHLLGEVLAVEYRVHQFIAWWCMYCGIYSSSSQVQKAVSHCAKQVPRSGNVTLCCLCHTGLEQQKSRTSCRLRTAEIQQPFQSVPHLKHPSKPHPSKQLSGMDGQRRGRERERRAGGFTPSSTEVHPSDCDVLSVNGNRNGGYFLPSPR